MAFVLMGLGSLISRSRRRRRNPLLRPSAEDGHSRLRDAAARCAIHLGLRRSPLARSCDAVHRAWRGKHRRSKAGCTPTTLAAFPRSSACETPAAPASLMILARFYPLDDPCGYGAENLGNFVIKRVRTVESKIGTIGIAHKIDFTLELTRYGDDRAGGSSARMATGLEGPNVDLHHQAFTIGSIASATRDTDRPPTRSSNGFSSRTRASRCTASCCRWASPSICRTLRES